jgi:hypothetical protein
LNSFSFIPHPSSLIPKLRRALRGEVDARRLALETLRRSRLSLRQRRERSMLEQLDKAPARIHTKFARMTPSALLEHFRHRTAPQFLPGFDASTQSTTAELQRTLFPNETAALCEQAETTLKARRWELMGYGEKDFGERDAGWLRDPLSGADWPLDYHADVKVRRDDGSDVRVLWEVNRLAHLLTLGRAYALTNDERFALEFFAEVESWRRSNPVGRGPNWMCAMEVALRAMNLIGAFELFRRSPHLDEERLQTLLAIFDNHGAHIRRNLEFSYITTSNHYLSDVVGLLWLGLMLPELEDARAWREFGLREMLREMEKQVLEDGADVEASTGYHRFVIELFLYSFILCRANAIEIEERYWRRLHAMLDYVRAYVRPDGRAPLIGDTDSGQVMPLRRRTADDHAYVLSVGAAAFNEPRFKASAGNMTEELLWILGAEGVRGYRDLTPLRRAVESQAFHDAGTYILRDEELYLLFNASDSGLDGRGSHGHNDALSVEISACGVPFVVDPGTYVYSADRHARHLFRSTAYHSTVEVDGVEQNTMTEELPFVIGNEARPRVLRWESGPARDIVIAEHNGYRRLTSPVTHRRAVEFDKKERYWTIEDSLTGEGEHVFRFSFHLAVGLETSVGADGIVQACDKIKRARLFICALGLDVQPSLEPQFTSRDYGAKSASVAACWRVRARCPVVVRWVVVPACAGDDEQARLELISRRRAKVSAPGRQ